MPVMSVADEAVAAGLESLDSVNTRIAYETQWRLFTLRCDELGLTPLPADPATVVDYLEYRGVAGASSATLRQVASAITNAHGWAGYESPCGDRRVRECRKGLARRLAKPPREAGALTDDAIRDMEKHAGHRRARGRGSETKEEAAERAKVDVALVNVMSDAGLRRSEGDALTWGNVQHWKDGSGRITVPCSQAAVESQAAVVAITVAAMRKLDAIRPAGRGRRREGIRALGIGDRAAGEGERKSCQAVQLGRTSMEAAGGSAWPNAWSRRKRHLT